MGHFFVADLNVRGELLSRAEYRYEDLEHVPGAQDLIVHCATILYRKPQEFELEMPGHYRHVTLRWYASAETAGLATVRCNGKLASLSLLATGLEEDADRLTLGAFQQYLLRELHDTGVEPAFALLDLTDRPLVATINFESPPDRADRMLVALADRCFGAAYFRYQNLA